MMTQREGNKLWNFRVARRKIERRKEEEGGKWKGKEKEKRKKRRRKI